MKNLELRLRQEIKDLETRLSGSTQALEFKIQKMESTLTIRLGTMLAASIAVMTALQVYLFKLAAHI
jgi:hypothetical protein